MSVACHAVDKPVTIKPMIVEKVSQQTCKILPMCSGSEIYEFR